MKLVAIAALLLGFRSICASAAPGDPLVVAADGAALLARPAADAPVLLRLSRGHRLVEVERQDSWLRVTVAGIHLPGRDIWIPAAATGPAEPGQVKGEIEILEDESLAPVGVAPHTVILEVTGTAARFRSDCRLAGRAGSVRQRVIRGELPAAVELPDGAVSCLVSKQDSAGRLRAALKSGGGVLAFAETAAPFGTVRVAASSLHASAGQSVRRTQPILILPFPSAPPPLPPRRHDRQPPVSGNPVPPFTQSPVPAFR